MGAVYAFSEHKVIRSPLVAPRKMLKAGEVAVTHRARITLFKFWKFRFRRIADRAFLTSRDAEIVGAVAFHLEAGTFTPGSLPPFWGSSADQEDKDDDTDNRDNHAFGSLT